MWGPVPSYGDALVTITILRSRDSTIPSPHLHRDSASMDVLHTPLYGCVYLYVFICINILILSDALMHLCIDVLYVFTYVHLRTCVLMCVHTYVFIRICMWLRTYILLLGLASGCHTNAPGGKKMTPYGSPTKISSCVFLHPSVHTSLSLPFPVCVRCSHHPGCNRKIPLRR